MIHHIEETRINEEVIKNTSKMTIVNFAADWCAPCQMLAPVLHEIDKKYPELEVYRVNVDESPNANITYGIHSVPTMIFFKDGVEVERKIGVISIQKISEIIESF